MNHCERLDYLHGIVSQRDCGNWCLLGRCGREGGREVGSARGSEVMQPCRTFL